MIKLSYALSLACRQGRHFCKSGSKMLTLHENFHGLRVVQGRTSF